MVNLDSSFFANPENKVFFEAYISEERSIFKNQKSNLNSESLSTKTKFKILMGILLAGFLFLFGPAIFLILFCFLSVLFG